MRMISRQINYKKLYAPVLFGVMIGLLGGCIAVGPPAFSYEAQKRGNALCAQLYGARDIQSLSSKMPILPGQLPSREMLMINQAPSEKEVLALGTLESAMRNCKVLRAASGQPTSASEDILEARVSKLRYGLFNGDIPFAVYNYGLAQVLKKHTAFMVEGETALSVSKARGNQRLLDMQMNSALRNLSAPQAKTWSCTSTPVDDTLYSNCY